MTHEEHHAAKTLGIGKAIAVLTSGGDAQGKEEGPAWGGTTKTWLVAPLSYITPLACRTELPSLMSSPIDSHWNPGLSQESLSGLSPQVLLDIICSTLIYSNLHKTSFPSFSEDLGPFWSLGT